MLAILEQRESSGTHRLTLDGELDLSTAATVKSRLGELAAAKQPLRIDLSRLDFVDSTGLALLVRLLKEARENGWHLEIGHDTNSQVARIIDVSGVDELFWPRAR